MIYNAKVRYAVLPLNIEEIRSESAWQGSPGERSQPRFSRSLLPERFSGPDSSALPRPGAARCFGQPTGARAGRRVSPSSPLSDADAARCRSAPDAGRSRRVRYGKIRRSDFCNPRNVEFESAAVAAGYDGLHYSSSAEFLRRVAQVGGIARGAGGLDD